MIETPTQTTPTQTTTAAPAPVVRQANVRLAPPEAFRLFTDRAAEWWPLVTHSVWGEDAATCRFEGQLGGRFFEIHRDGRECDWGRVLAWEPPRRVVFSFYPGRPEQEATEVEVTFEPQGTGTRLTLVHRGWEARGDQAQKFRDGYYEGWGLVLGEYERVSRN
jgi:uncharacterized protein YndB with AHSA1/START domain